MRPIVVITLLLIVAMLVAGRINSAARGREAARRAEARRAQEEAEASRVRQEAEAARVARERAQWAARSQQPAPSVSQPQAEPVAPPGQQAAAAERALAAAQVAAAQKEAEAARLILRREAFNLTWLAYERAQQSSQGDRILECVYDDDTPHFSPSLTTVEVTLDYSCQGRMADKSERRHAIHLRGSFTKGADGWTLTPVR